MYTSMFLGELWGSTKSELDQSRLAFTHMYTTILLERCEAQPSHNWISILSHLANTNAKKMMLIELLGKKGFITTW